MLRVGLSHAQTGDARPMLSGPEIREVSLRTIVRRDAMGRFDRVEGRPEEAALLQLSLDPTVRDAANEVVRERAIRMSRVLVENIEGVRDATDALQAGRGEDARRIMHGLWEKVDGVETRSPLLEPLAEVLPPRELQALTEMVDEYWEAWIDASSAGAMAQEDVERRLSAELFQEEIRLAYERTLRPVRERLERIYAVTEATPEQRAMIRNAFIDHVKQHGLVGDDASRLALARRVYKSLDEEQRVRLLASALR